MGEVWGNMAEFSMLWGAGIIWHDGRRGVFGPRGGLTCGTFCVCGTARDGVSLLSPSSAQWNRKLLHHNLSGRGYPGIFCVSSAAGFLCSGLGAKSHV